MEVAGNIVCFMVYYGEYVVRSQSLPRWLATSLLDVKSVPWMYHTSRCHALDAIDLLDSSAILAIPVFMHYRVTFPIYSMSMLIPSLSLARQPRWFARVWPLVCTTNFLEP